MKRLILRLNVTMKHISVKKTLALLIFFLIAVVLLHTVINYRKSITDLSENEKNEIFAIVGLSSAQSIDILSFQVRWHANVGYCLIELKGIDNIDDFVSSNTVINSSKKVDDGFCFDENSKLFPRGCEYCVLLYDDSGNTYLSVKHNSNYGGTELADYFFELYNQRK